ncbi:hypothetical protein PVL29_022821 [Vitis rotundifolia]|uniref:MADS-box domain-containing protein n=1 Tax=Vitis rotundifolia TaxID=103349 RepID=A0AA38YWM0_VITRO|nr:hypothetical protein PVL29_022821 [Vitis rotundifolia]
MAHGKLKIKLIANEKLRCRTFRNRQKGLKKKLHELSTLCDVEACMIIYCDQNGNGTYSSQPDVWPENHYEVQRLLQKLQEKNGKTKGQTSETRLELDGLSYEKLMEINDKLDRKLEHVKSLIDLKKGQAGLMSKTPMMNMENNGYPEFGSGKASSSELLHHSTQFQDPIHCDPPHGMFKNNTDPSTSYQKMGTVPTKQEMSVSNNTIMFNTHPTNSMPQMGLSENMMFDMDHSIFMQQISAYRQYLLDGYLFFHC